MDNNTAIINTHEQQNILVDPQLHINIAENNTARSASDLIKINQALEEENSALKKQIRQLETENKKQIALLEQKLELKDQEFNELKESQNQLKKMNETIMSAVSDVNRSSTNPFMNKAIKELEAATDQHNKEMNELKARTNEAIKVYELEVKKLKEQLGESELKYKELHLNTEKDKIQYMQRIKELESEHVSVEFYNKRYEEEKSRNKNLEISYHELLIKYTDTKQQIENMKIEYQMNDNIDRIQDWPRKDEEESESRMKIDEKEQHYLMEIENLNKSIMEMQSQYKKEIFGLKKERDEAIEKSEKLEANLTKMKLTLKANQALQEQNSKILKEKMDALVNTMDQNEGIIEQNKQYKQEISSLKTQIVKLESEIKMKGLSIDKKQKSSTIDSSSKKITLNNSDNKMLDRDEDFIIQENSHSHRKQDSKQMNMYNSQYSSNHKNDLINENTLTSHEVSSKNDLCDDNKNNNNSNSKYPQIHISKSLTSVPSNNAHIKKNNIINETQTERLSHIQHDLLYTDDEKSNISSTLFNNDKGGDIQDKKKQQLRVNPANSQQSSIDFLNNTRKVKEKSLDHDIDINNYNSKSSAVTASNKFQNDNASSVCNPTSQSLKNASFAQDVIEDFNTSETCKNNGKTKYSLNMKGLNSNNESIALRVSSQNLTKLLTLRGGGLEERINSNHPEENISKNIPMNPQIIETKEANMKKKKVDINNMPINYNEFVKKSERSKWIKPNDNSSSIETQFGETIDAENLIGETFKYNGKDREEVDNSISLDINNINEMKNTIREDTPDTNNFISTNQHRYSETYREESDIERKFSFFANQYNHPPMSNGKSKKQSPRKGDYNSLTNRLANEREICISNSKNTTTSDSNHFSNIKQGTYTSSNHNNLLNNRSSSNIKSTASEQKLALNETNYCENKLRNNDDSNKKLKEINCKIKELELRNEGNKIEKEKVQLELEKLRLELEVVKLEQEPKQQLPTSTCKSSNRHPLENSQQMNLSINCQTDSNNNRDIYYNLTLDKGMNKENAFHDKENAYKTEIKFLINNLLKARNKLEKQNDELSTKNANITNTQLPTQNPISTVGTNITLMNRQSCETFGGFSGSTINSQNNNLLSCKNQSGNLNLSTISTKGNHLTNNNFSNSTTRSHSPFSLQANTVASSLNMNSNVKNNPMIRLSHQSITQNSIIYTNEKDNNKDEIEQKGHCKNKSSLNQAIENFAKNVNRSRSNLRPFDNNMSIIGLSGMCHNHVTSIDGGNISILNQSTNRSSRAKSPNSQQKIIGPIGMVNNSLNNPGYYVYDKQNIKGASSYTIRKKIN